LARNAIDASMDSGIWELKGVSPVLVTLTTPWEVDVTKEPDSVSVFQESLGEIVINALPTGYLSPMKTGPPSPNGSECSTTKKVASHVPHV